MISSLITLAALGAFHQIEPGDGVACRGRARDARRTPNGVWRALIPLTIGHCLAIGAAVLAASASGIAFTPRSPNLRWPVGLLLIGLGIRLCYRHRHVRWASMRVGMGGLTWWSFLIASAHGAGPHGSTALPLDDGGGRKVRPATRGERRRRPWPVRRRRWCMARGISP